MDQTEYIRSKIQAHSTRNRVQVQSIVPQIPLAERSSFMARFLASCCVLVSFATMCLVGARGMGWEPSWKRRPVQAPVQTPVVEQNREQYITHAEVAAALASLDSKVTGLDASFKKWNNRVWLLGLAHNENTAMIKSLNQKCHPNEPNDYLMFDREWKINRMPRTMQIEGADSETLRNSVK